MTDTSATAPPMIPALGSTFPATSERLSASYEVTRTNALQVRSHQGPVEPATQARIAERIRLLEHALQPHWTVACLHASIPMPPRLENHAGVPVDDLQQSLASFAAVSQILPREAREAFSMTATLTAPLSSGTPVDVEFEAKAVVEPDQPPAGAVMDVATEVLTRTGTRAWSDIMSKMLGAWMYASGISRLQISGTFGWSAATLH